VFGFHLQRIPGIMWTQGVFGNVKVTAWELFWLVGYLWRLRSEAVTLLVE